MYANLILGMILFAVGLLIQVNPIIRIDRVTYKFTWDFTEIKIPLSITFIILGIAFIYIFFRNTGRSDSEYYLICPKCLKPSSKIDHGDKNCVACGQELEVLEGFYDRHPELKEKKQT